MQRNPYKIAIAIMLLFLVIICRVGYLSLIKGDDLQAMSSEQRTRHLDYYQYARGDFLDTLGRPLTGIEENCLVIFPAMLEDAHLAAQALAEIIGYEASFISSRIHDNNNRTASPYIFKTGLSSTETANITKANISGVVALPLAARYTADYPVNHLLGMLLPSGEKGAYHGASGLEQEYEEYLAERQDKQVVAYVDVGGVLTVKNLYVVSPEETSYNNVQLTINLDYQQIVERAFGELSGACVIMDPYSGDVLAAVSVPGYDPYGWEDLAADDVYINKAFSLYPPASTFKIVLATAALETGITPLMEGTLTANQAAALEEEGSHSLPENNSGSFYCDGAYTLAEGYDVACWNKEGHGEMNLHDAVVNSCNCYFVGLGLALGGERIKEYASRFGLDEQTLLGYALGTATHIDFSNYIDGDIANASIGEKGIRISPLQSAVMISACANGGYLLEPRLVKGVYDNNGNSLITIDSGKRERIFSEQTAYTLKEMLTDAVLYGTGTNAVGQEISAAGKTGTTEDFGVWFCGFAPVDKPLYAISIYVSNGSSGGTEAAGIFSKIIDDLAVLDGI